jgi:hypothetical protein
VWSTPYMLEEFNRHIVGEIEVTAEFHASKM